ncbi:hypothetical protein IFR05_010678 [Cadophora sp. M221]|nr:hypothetical protein IFR05_010678 [Cadophora sp. M221]
MLSILLSLSASNVLLLAIAAPFLLAIFQYVSDPLRAVPGPRLARYTRLWYLYKIYQGQFEKVNIGLHQRYGPVVRIAPNEYSIDDVAAAKTIYGHGNSFVKAPWYRAWMPPDPSQASLFADLDPHHHSLQRRKFASAYSMTSLMSYEPYVNNCLSLFITRFSEIARSGRSVDFAHWFQCYAFDVIGEITFGRRFGFLDGGIDGEDVFGAIESRTAYSTYVGMFPMLHDVLFHLLPRSGGHGFVGSYTRTRIASREQDLNKPELPEKNIKGPEDFVSKFLRIRAEDPGKMTNADIFTMCQSNIGAGSDTTAITLSSILYHLLQHPTTHKRLQAELDEGIGSGAISSPITFKEANQLPYLQAVIKEALRLHPATGLPLARIVPSTGASIAGYNFPSGATVGINSWVAHHNTSIFGDDAGSWRPERWLEFQEQGRGAEVEKYFFAFGMGGRTCVGRNLSLLEVGKLIPEIVRRFEFVMDGGEVSGVGWKSISRWFVKPVEFEGRVSERNGKWKMDDM